MSKRFRDTDIWKKGWYRKLTPEQKCAWGYLCDECDAVGVIRLDVEAADFFIGATVDWTSLLEAVNGNIEVLSDGKWFLTDFCFFQYGPLKQECLPHRSYLKLLAKHGLSERVPEGYKKGIHTLKEKEKEKDKEKERAKGIDRSAAPAPECPTCHQPCSRDHGYWRCEDHGVQADL